MNPQDLILRKQEILLKAMQLDYESFRLSEVAFDYEAMMESTSFTMDEARTIQHQLGVGNTPLLRLDQLSTLAKKLAKPGYGATILLKDEACNLSGSFKARRASLSCYMAKKLGYQGVIAATSGNYGAAVAAMCAKLNLKCIIVQECFDDRHIGQPEIMEKARACEAYGAQVIQLTVGPELFTVLLDLLDQTGYFNASLYSPYGVAGVETLGQEIIEQTRNQYHKDPSAVIITHAGGGNVTATARGIKKMKADSVIVGASVDLSGLSMASDYDFNRKSFTTGHTGFGFPFAQNPDRSDVVFSAARPLRYLDRYVTVKQGEVFYITEALAKLEGLERGPAGNTALAAASVLAQQMKEDELIVVQETEYTGAGKHFNAQLSFAKHMGIRIRVGDPKDEIAGESIVIPALPSLLRYDEVDLNRMRRSYLNNKFKEISSDELSDVNVAFFMEETRCTKEEIIRQWEVFCETK